MVSKLIKVILFWPLCHLGSCAILVCFWLITCTMVIFCKVMSKVWKCLQSVAFENEMDCGVCFCLSVIVRLSLCFSPHKHAYTCTPTPTSSHACMHTNTHTHMHTQLHIVMHTHTHTHIRTHTHTHTHTCKHARAHTHTHTHLLSVYDYEALLHNLFLTDPAYITGCEFA